MRAVQEKVRRANEVFLGLHSNRDLCFCCVEFVQGPSSSTLTYLCGHSFHTQCVDEWYRRHSGKQDEGCSAVVSSKGPGRCPVCEGDVSLEGDENLEGSAAVEEESGGRLADCARLFAMQSLSERYPHIMTQDTAKRWASRPTGILLSDMQFSRHKSRSKFKCEPCLGNGGLQGGGS